MQVDGQEKRGLDAQAKLEIEEGVLKLETLVENAVDKNFDKLEIWTLRNVLCLPRGKEGEEELGRWIRLGHYEVRELLHWRGLGGSSEERNGAFAAFPGGHAGTRHEGN